MYCMVEYTPEEVDTLIKLLRKVKPKGSLKIEKTIRYLDQRHKFFNPNKEMLIYIIKHGDNFKLDPDLLLKMKNDMVTKKSK